MSELGIERAVPYVGVSGVVSPEQQEVLEDMADAIGLLDAGRILSLGVKAVHKTQWLDIENKYGPEWYPVGEEGFVGAAKPANDETMLVAQLYLEPEELDNISYRYGFVRRVVERGGYWLDGLQFDMLPWHDDDEMLRFIEDIKEEHELQVFLQCHHSAMELLGPEGAAKRLGQVGDVVDYVLFDASHGKGIPMNIAFLRPFIDAAYCEEGLNSTGVAVAGGLDARTVRESLPRLVREFPELSWDAEGKLHTETSEGERPLQMEVVEQYLRASTDVIIAN